MKNATQDWLQYVTPENIKVKAFYPYTSRVQMPILSQNHNYQTEEHDFVDFFADMVWKLAKELDCKKDNKIVVEIEVTRGDCSTRLFVGWYDWIRKIGLGYSQPDHYTKQYNQYFD